MSHTLSDPGSASAPSISMDLDAEALLPRAPGVFRRWIAAHPRAVDWIIIGCYLAGCALMVLVTAVVPIGDAGYIPSAPLSEQPVVLGVVPVVDAHSTLRAVMFNQYLQFPWVCVVVGCVAITCIALRLRRSQPLAGLIVVSLLQVFEQGLLVVPNAVAIFFLLFAIPVHRSTKQGWIGWALSAVITTVILQLESGYSVALINPSGVLLSNRALFADDFPSVSIVNAVWLLAVLLIGINLGNRRRYVNALIDRAHQLVREREQREQIAAGAERARIAREMHDVVAHSLSVVVTLSEAAAVAIDSKPSQARQAVERAAETGREALVEMRRLLGVLNESGESAALQPQPGVAQLSALVAGFAEAGLRVAFAERGVAQGDASQQLAVYRIVQEGLTNALRHAGPRARAELTLEHTDTATEITLIDSGPRGAAEQPSPAAAGRTATTPSPATDRAATRLTVLGSGRGLAGATQRAALFGGSLTSRAHGNGWKLVARVPVTRDPQTRDILPS